MSKKALILTYEKYQDHEVIYPYYRVQEEGFDVDIMSNVNGKIFGILGTYMESTRTVSELDNQNSFYNILDEYDFLVIPGGVKALEKLRQEQNALKFISEWDKRGKTIACICHGGQMLISAKITKGRDVSGYYSIKDDINNAGAVYTDEPAVVDGNIVTTAHYKDLGIWMKTALDLASKVS